MDWLDLLAVQGTLKSLLQHHSSKASILCSAFFTVQLSHPYMTTGKTIALTRWIFVGKRMSLLFNMLSRLVITFLPRSKHLLILSVALSCVEVHCLLFRRSSSHPAVFMRALSISLPHIQWAGDQDKVFRATGWKKLPNKRGSPTNILLYSLYVRYWLGFGWVTHQCSLQSVVTRTVLPNLSQIRVALQIMKSPFMAMMLCSDDAEGAVPGDSSTVRGSDQIQVHTDFYQKNGSS